MSKLSFVPDKLVVSMHMLLVCGLIKSVKNDFVSTVTPVKQLKMLSSVLWLTRADFGSLKKKRNKTFEKKGLILFPF